jgi:hypothetical protein
MFTNVLSADNPYCLTWVNLLNSLNNRAPAERETILLECHPDCIIPLGTSKEDVANLYFTMGISFEQYANHGYSNSKVYYFTLENGDKIYWFAVDPLLFAKNIACKLYNLPA